MPADVEADLDRIVRRLRSLPSRFWRGDVSVVRRLVADLVVLGPPGHEPPDPPVHALPDAVAVLAREAIAAGHAEEATGLIRAALAATS